jgi:hypothetical protein
MLGSGKGMRREVYIQTSGEVIGWRPDVLPIFRYLTLMLRESLLQSLLLCVGYVALAFDNYARNDSYVISKSSNDNR